jgi:hypothetical protein
MALSLVDLLVLLPSYVAGRALATLLNWAFNLEAFYQAKAVSAITSPRRTFREAGQ